MPQWLDEEKGMHNSIPISEGVREGNCYQELEGEHYMEIMLMAIVALAA